MTSQHAGVFRLCPSCQVRFILPVDLHPCCDNCLGTEHAGVALTARANCAFCTPLPVAELQGWAKAFLSMHSNGERDDSWADRASISLEEALVILDQSGGPATGPKLARSIASTPPGLPSPRWETWKKTIRAKNWRLYPLSQLSTSSPHPLAHVPAKALLQDLPCLIRMVADIKHLAM